jgi:hypothetical protein
MAKRIFGVMIGLLVVLAFCGFVFAQATPQPAKPEAMKPAETKAEPAKAPEMKPEKKTEMKEAPPKPVMYRLGGIVVAVDAKANKITIDQKAVKKERKLSLRVGKKATQQMAGIGVGDVVNAWVTDSTITKLVKVF